MPSERPICRSRGGSLLLEAAQAAARSGKTSEALAGHFLVAAESEGRSREGLHILESRLELVPADGLVSSEERQLLEGLAWEARGPTAGAFEALNDALEDGSAAGAAVERQVRAARAGMNSAFAAFAPAVGKRRYGVGKPW